MDHLRSAWQGDLDKDITEEQWQTALTQIHKSSACVRHGLLQFKTIHRLHWTKQKLHKIFPEIDPSCDRCGLEPASVGHMFWSCPRILNYWNNIFQTLSEILYRPINADPLVAILGIIDSTIVKNSAEHNMISFVSLLARRLILLNWKQKTAPTHANLMADVMKYLEIEKITFSLKNQEGKFYRIWQPFIDHFKRHSNRSAQLAGKI